MDVDYGPKSQELRRAVFGSSSVVPTIFLAVIEHMARGAEQIVGVIEGEQLRVYWLKGTIFGELTCDGLSEETAAIAARVHRLTDPLEIELQVGKEYDGFDRQVDWWGRILTLRFGVGIAATIDAMKGSVEQRARVEMFVDAILARL